jgi:hypothetical protein
MGSLICPRFIFRNYPIGITQDMQHAPPQAE